MAAEFLRHAEVQADRLGVPDVEVAVRLRRKAGDDLVHPAGIAVGGDDVANEVLPGFTDGRIGGGHAVFPGRVNGDDCASMCQIRRQTPSPRGTIVAWGLAFAMPDRCAIAPITEDRQRVRWRKPATQTIAGPANITTGTGPVGFHPELSRVAGVRPWMRRSTALVVTLAAILVAIGGPLLAAIHIATREAEKAEISHTLDYARDVLNRSETTSDQIDEGDKASGRRCIAGPMLGEKHRADASDRPGLQLHPGHGTRCRQQHRLLVPRHRAR